MTVLLGLTPAQQKAYDLALVTGYVRRTDAFLIDRAERTVASLGPQVKDGQVQIDTTQTISRALTLTLNDPLRKLDFDVNTYTGADLNFNRHIAVRYVISSPLLSRAVSCPVFYGPVSSLGRTGSEVRIGGVGMELFGTQPSLVTRSWAAKTNVTSLIRALLALAGYKRVSIPALSRTTPNKVTLDVNTSVWALATSLAHSIGYQLYADSRGLIVMRPWPGHPAYTFTSGLRVSNATILEALETNVDLSEVRNVVRVTGATPKGAKLPVIGQRTLNAGHPLSPTNLGFAGSPLNLLEQVSNDNCKTVADCLNLAERVLEQKARLVGQHQLTVKPIPYLEEGDVYAEQTDEGYSLQRLQQATIPIGPGGNMALGWNAPYGLQRPKGHTSGSYYPKIKRGKKRKAKKKGR